MYKYVVFFKGNRTKFIRKELADSATVNALKKQGYKKHHVDVEAENECDAKTKFNEFNNAFLDALHELSGHAVICAVSVIVIAVIFIIRLW